MMYGASWMDLRAASSWISERGLSGRQISGGGSSPNSSRMTSARDVMSQHSMGGVRICETGTAKRKSVPLRLFSPVQSAASDYEQSMVHSGGLTTPMVHFFGVLAWMAMAFHSGGGPGTLVAVTVMSTVGLNP